MPPPVNTRRYDAEHRHRQSRERKARILEAATHLFTTRGYAATSMVEIARAAGVALDTVYAAVGPKPRLLLAVHDLVLGEGAVDEQGDPLSSLQRSYVAHVRAAESAAGKIAVYAEAMSRLLPVTAPLAEALRTAGATDPECREVWDSLQRRRAERMLLFAADLRATGELRADLSDGDVADLVWSMNDAGFFTALSARGWTPERYGALVREVWTRTLLV